MKHCVIFLTLFAAAALQSTQAQQGWSVIFDNTDRVNGVLQTSSGTLLVGNRSNGIYRSSDDGATFDFVQGFACMEFFIEFAETRGGMLYAITDVDVYQSIDDGIHWSNCYLRRYNGYSVVPTAMVSIGDSVLVACKLGLMKSDNGFVWDTVSLHHLGDMAVLGDGSIIGIGDELLRSTDGGARWEALGASMQYNGHFTAGKGNTVFYTSGPVYRSDDLGAHWDEVDAFRHVVGPQAVAVHSDGTIIHNAMATLYRSTDDGLTWAELPDPWNGCGYSVFYFDRQGRLYADYTVGRIVRTDRSITATETAVGPSTLECVVLPNPSVGEAQLHITLARHSRLNATLVDALGRVTDLLADAEMDAGTHVVDIPAGLLPPGVYHVRMSAAGESLVRRFVRSR